MNSQFQLGLELTNIFNPLAQAVSALGSLALIDAIKKGGSDALTELKLGAILVRNRIDSIIELHFKQFVAKSEKIALSQYLEDIMLESGAGPTVQNAFKSNELFSMVIQLSVLCYVHEINPLANALIEAINRNAQLLKAASGSEPDYVSLCGTLRVIQQETAGFRWSYLFDGIERKIRAALEDCRPRKRKKASINPRENVNKDCPSVDSRRLPFPILQVLLVSLHQLQHFPEERILSIECASGITTLVVWCYHILGLNVKLLIKDSEIRFGDDHINIFIKESRSQVSTASLLLPHAQEEPLFTLSSQDGDPFPGPELRTSARGFGHQLLRQIDVSEEKIDTYRTWVMNRSFDARQDYEESHNEAQFYTRVDVIRAASFLFDLTPNDVEKAEHRQGFINPQPRHRSYLSALVLILLSLTRIEAANLQKCHDLPCCLSIRPLIEKYESSFGVILSGQKILDLAQAFDILSHVLLGPLISEDTIDRAILVSARGWSLFFDSINKVDPAEVAISSLRIEFGVPNRRGVRKTRIIDGPTDLEFSPSEAVTFKTGSKRYINFFPGVSRARRGRALISEHGSDAFQVTQSFVWQYQQKVPRTHILGFREMLDVCAQFRRLSPCRCDNMVKYEDFVSSYIENSKFHEPLALQSEFFWLQDCKPFKYLDASGQPSYKGKNLDESVLNTQFIGNQTTDEAWFFHVSNDPAARWMQICELYPHNVDTYQANYGPKPGLFIRSPETCFGCAINKVVSHCRKSSLRVSEDVVAFVLL